MKKLGLVGGTGPESTLMYYRQFVYGANSRVGGNFFPNLAIESINVYDILDMCSEKNYQGLTQYLVNAINKLIASGAEIIALTGNTPHIVFDEVQAKVAVPMVSIITATYTEIKKQNLNKVGLLGTQFTMESDFFKHPFLLNGIDVIVPNQSERDFISTKIHDELEKGIISAATRDKFISIIDRMSHDDKIESIILGCTELPLLFQDTELKIPSIDIVDIHIKTLFDVLGY